jgi:hypothetical protein
MVVFLERILAEIVLVVVAVVLPAFMLALAIPYAILRMRDARGGRADPQLGFKVAMNYFFSLALVVVLTGATLFVIDLLDFRQQFRGPRLGREPFPTTMQRWAFGFVLAGLVFMLIHFVCIVTLTSEPFSSPVRRTFLGWRFALHGLVVLFALTGLFVVLFQRDGTDVYEAQRTMVAMLLVWTPSWFLHFVLFRVSSPKWRLTDRAWRGADEPEEDWEPAPRRPAPREEP